MKTKQYIKKILINTVIEDR